MSYADKENSVQEGSPFFLYEFIRDGVTYRFVDLPEDGDYSATGNSETWTNLTITHDSYSLSEEVAKSNLKVTLPLDGDFAEDLKNWAPESKTYFTLYRGHIGESDYLIYWKGRVISQSFDEQTITIKCESIYTSLKRSGLRSTYTRTCRHILYSNGCGLNAEDFKIEGSLDNVNSIVEIELSNISSYDDGYLSGGFAVFPDGSERTILTHVGSIITLSRTSKYLQEDYTIGDLISVYPGCDKLRATCKSKFSNQINYGGFPWVPDENPIDGSSIV